MSNIIRVVNAMTRTINFISQHRHAISYTYNTDVDSHNVSKQSSVGRHFCNHHCYPYQYFVTKWKYIDKLEINWSVGQMKKAWHIKMFILLDIGVINYDIYSLYRFQFYVIISKLNNMQSFSYVFFVKKNMNGRKH